MTLSNGLGDQQIGGRLEMTGEHAQAEAMDRAKSAAEQGMADRFLAQLADRMGGQAGVNAVFGTPIERGDLTVVPVARTRWLFGGGAGSGSDASNGDATPGAMSGTGSGGGGGVAADPIGYLKVGPDDATFETIVAPYPSPFFILASGIAAAMIIRALAQLVRR
jgi:uncharacterized spore protein YtfJ